MQFSVLFWSKPQPSEKKILIYFCNKYRKKCKFYRKNVKLTPKKCKTYRKKCNFYTIDFVTYLSEGDSSFQRILTLLKREVSSKLYLNQMGKVADKEYVLQHKLI